MAKEETIIGTIKLRKRNTEGFDYVKFGEELNESYKSQARENKFRTKKSFSPSSIGYGNGNCPRYWYIAFTGAEFKEEARAKSVANMSNGSAAHDRLQKVITDIGRPVDHEVELIHNDPPIWGFIDSVLDWDGDKVIVEIKTAKQESYDVRKATMKPSPNHLLQLLIYMKLQKAKYGVFIYENKNDQELTLIPITVSDKYIKIVDETFDWMRAVRKAFDDKTLPTRSFTKSKPACKGCPVFDECWFNLPDGEVTIPALVPPA